MTFEKWISLIPGSKLYNYIFKVLRDKDDYEFTVRSSKKENFKVKQEKIAENQFAISCYQIIEMPDEQLKENKPLHEEK